MPGARRAQAWATTSHWWSVPLRNHLARARVQPLVHVATRVLMTRLFLQCLTLAAFSFGLYWLGKTGGWLRNIDQQLKRIEAKLDARA